MNSLEGWRQCLPPGPMTGWVPDQDMKGWICLPAALYNSGPQLFWHQEPVSMEGNFSTHQRAGGGEGIVSGWFKYTTFIVHFIPNLMPPLISQGGIGPKPGGWWPLLYKNDGFLSSAHPSCDANPPGWSTHWGRWALPLWELKDKRIWGKLEASAAGWAMRK